MYLLTLTPLTVMLPELALVIPGNAAICETMALPKVVLLPIAASARSRFMSASGTVAITMTDPDSSTTTTSAGSMVLPRVVDMSSAMDCCTAKTKEALKLASAMSAS
jgi:hypothetical protein